MKNIKVLNFKKYYFSVMFCVSKLDESNNSISENLGAFLTAKRASKLLFIKEGGPSF